MKTPTVVLLMICLFGGWFFFAHRSLAEWSEVYSRTQGRPSPGTPPLGDVPDYVLGIHETQATRLIDPRSSPLFEMPFIYIEDDELPFVRISLIAIVILPVVVLVLMRKSRGKRGSDHANSNA